MGIMDEINAQVDEQKKEQAGNITEDQVMFDKTEVYHSKVEPLIKQILSIAEEEGIPVVVATQYKADEKGSDYSLSAIADVKRGASRQFMVMINNDKAIMDGKLNGAMTINEYRVNVAKFGMAAALLIAKMYDEEDSEKRKALLEDLAMLHMSLAYLTKGL